MGSHEACSTVAVSGPRADRMSEARIVWNAWPQSDLSPNLCNEGRIVKAQRTSSAAAALSSLLNQSLSQRQPYQEDLSTPGFCDLPFSTHLFSKTNLPRQRA